MRSKIKEIINRINIYLGFRKDNSITGTLKRVGIDFNNKDVGVVLLLHDIVKNNDSLTKNDIKILDNPLLSWDQIYVLKQAANKGMDLSLFGFPELTPAEMKIAMLAMSETGKSFSILKKYSDINYLKVIKCRFSRFGLNVDDYSIIGHLVIIDYCIKKNYTSAISKI